MNIKPMYAGSWYPSDATSLRALINKYLDIASQKTPTEKFFRKQLLALIAPHAGYVYSGQTAAMSYHLLQSYLSPNDLIILLAPSHRQALDYIAIIRQRASFHTPLGSIATDHFFGSLLDDELFIDNPLLIEKEHAIEMQLPFIHHISLGQAQIFPMVLGQLDKAKLNQAINNLKQAITTYQQSTLKNIFLVASSDLSHFHPANAAELIDAQFIPILSEALDNKDIFYFYEKCASNKIEACGAIAIALLCGSLLDQSVSLNLELLHRCHSGQITGDNNRVVGYLSAGIFT